MAKDAPITGRRQSGMRTALEMRAELFDSIRAFFRTHGFLEVDTPNRSPFLLPEAHIDPLSSEDAYLLPSPEAFMKRLLASGYPKLFQICRCFRKGERGRFHLPEFVMLEWYETGLDYLAVMDRTEALIRAVASGLGYGSSLTYQGKAVDLSAPWQRLTVSDAFRTYADISMGTALDSDRFDEAMASDLEPSLGWDRPVFLYDYPASRASLARLKEGDPNIAERFELYICGIELCNGFSELTDALEQRERFRAENENRRAMGKPALPMPEAFLSAVSRMPEAGGNALGLDRLLMVLADTGQIDDVVPFVPEEH